MASPTKITVWAPLKTGCSFHTKSSTFIIFISCPNPLPPSPSSVRLISIHFILLFRHLSQPYLVPAKKSRHVGEGLTRIRPNNCAFKDVSFGANPLEFDSDTVKNGGHAQDFTRCGETHQPRNGSFKLHPAGRGSCHSVPRMPGPKESGVQVYWAPTTASNSGIVVVGDHGFSG